MEPFSFLSMILINLFRATPFFFGVEGDRYGAISLPITTDVRAERRIRPAAKVEGQNLFIMSMILLR